MRMKKIICYMTAVLVMLTVPTISETKKKSKRAKGGALTSSKLLAYASTSGAGGNSGRIWTGEGNIMGVGKATVLVKASWNWSFYNVDHPSALINNTPKDFYYCRVGKICAVGDSLAATADLTQGVVPGLLTNDYANGKIRRGHLNGFTADATVTITTPAGDVINAAILSGSVTEVQVPGTGGGGSINEWFIGFKITGGTGKFASASGSGFIQMVFDSGSAYTDTFDALLGTQVYQSDPREIPKTRDFPGGL